MSDPQAPAWTIKHHPDWMTLEEAEIIVMKRTPFEVPSDTRSWRIPVLHPQQVMPYNGLPKDVSIEEIVLERQL